MTFWDKVKTLNISSPISHIFSFFVYYLVTFMNFYLFSIFICSTPELANEHSHKHLLDYKDTSHNSSYSQA